jgi:hypothetical protein
VGFSRGVCQATKGTLTFEKGSVPFIPENLRAELLELQRLIKSKAPER